LREPRFVDLAPAEVYASLLDQGVYLCSIRTMYRVLAEHDEVRERRRQLRRSVYQSLNFSPRPNQVCPGHNQVDGAREMELFYLYVIIDIFSRRMSPGASPMLKRHAVQALVRRRHRQA